MLTLIDRLNLFEAYNGLKIANAAAPQLNLGSTISHFESKYALDLDNNNQYLALEEIPTAK